MAEQDRDLVLSPTQFAYVQDRTSGNVKVWVGPRADTLTANDRLVIWTGRKFIDQPDVNQSRQSFVTADENEYVVLTNPAKENHSSFPAEGSTTVSQSLDVGRRINIPGPVSFALWPGQTAEVIEGHRLSFNEYLTVEVYDPDAATNEQGIEEPREGAEEEPARSENYRVGERRVIKGTEKSFYIPPTGIEVIPETGPDGRRGGFVREAATLETLEYATLVDENGTKRIERGPQVVFPEPTEKFVTEKGERRFRAVELNAQSGIYVKVTEDYVHDGAESIQAWRGSDMVEVGPGEALREGDELFLTGKDTPIYFPRIEHSIVLYGDRRKHHAIAIPAGEGRYVLDRTSGEVRQVRGPSMFLPDPRIEVIVRRVLEQKTTTLWYPGNPEAAQVNLQLQAEQATKGQEYLSAESTVMAAAAATGQAGSLARSYQAHGGFGGDFVKRGTEYTPPRTITLDTKYLGPPRISVWPGYAVMVMDPTGNRRVETGPVDLLLEYHETLMALTLSTGRPKGTGAPIHTVYLRTVNNAVGDRVTVETRDLVPITLELSLRVNFEADTPEEAENWFAVEDYIALLTDHVRSKLRNLAKRHDVQRFYPDAIDLIRDALLGESKDGERTGLMFPDNGMRLYDVEVLNVEISEPSVRALLNGAMNESLRGAIEVSQAEAATEREARLDELERKRIASREETAEARSDAALSEIERELSRALRAIAGTLQEREEESKLAAVARSDEKAAATQDVELMRARDAAILERQTREVEQFVARAKAIDPRLVDAIRVYGQEKAVREISEAVAPVALAAGVPAVDILRKHLEGTAFSPFLDSLSERPFAARMAEDNGTEG